MENLSNLRKGKLNCIFVLFGRWVLYQGPFLVVVEGGEQPINSSLT